MRAGDQVLPAHDRLELAPHERDLARGLGVGLAGEEADQAQLADDVAVGVHALDPDVVHPRPPVDRGLGVGLRDDHERPAEDAPAHSRLERPDRHRLREPRPRLVGHHAQPGVRHDRDGGIVARAVDLILAVAQVDEAVVGEPLQELDRLRHVVGRPARAGGLGGLDHRLDPLHHRQEVAHHQAQVAQRLHEARAQHLERGVVEAAVGLEVHHRLPPGGATGGCNRLDPAGLRALDPHHRVHHGAHLEAVHVHLGGDGVDEERRVLDTDLDDRPARVPAVRLEVGVVGAHRQLAGRALVHEREQPGDVGGQLGRAQLADEQRRHPADVGADELGQQADAALAELVE